MSLSLEVSKFIEKEELFLDSEPLLCAVSGGMDSMVMLDVLRTLGYPLEIAHINYMLRDDDSMLDESTVVEYCSYHSLRCHIYRLSMDEVKDLKSGNLQEKARDIRYNWFSKVNIDYPKRPICTAHHQGDVAETFLLNALRGSGTKGLSSIRAKTGIYRRPLLCIEKDKIESYVKDKGVSYRQDLSNLDNVYDRNYIRHKVLTPLSKRWPESVKKLNDASANISKDYDLLSHLIKEAAKKWCHTYDQYIKIGPLKDLGATPHHKTFLFHMLHEYDFNSDMIASLSDMRTEAGATFKTSTHEATINQGYLVIKKSDHSEWPKSIEIQINKPSLIETAHGAIEIIEIKHAKVELVTNQYVEFIDATKVSWPLSLRTCKSSDRISPLGMNGKQKKVSDILIDQKANQFEKKEQLILIDKSGEIIWVIGRKLSEHFKFSEMTTQFLKLEFTKL